MPGRDPGKLPPVPQTWQYGAATDTVLLMSIFISTASNVNIITLSWLRPTNRCELHSPIVVIMNKRTSICKHIVLFRYTSCQHPVTAIKGHRHVLPFMTLTCLCIHCTCISFTNYILLAQGRYYILYSFHYQCNMQKHWSIENLHGSQNMNRYSIINYKKHVRALIAVRA